MRIVIAGGSAAGLFAALLLARAAHDVVVLDRDRLEPAPVAQPTREQLAAVLSR